jgi:branched-chain amino acid transport system ATP-binding protein
MTILALKNVSKSFGALKVTDDVSFEVPEGMALGIIGPNGAGKSTLFNLITGNIRADSGTIEFLGRDVTRTPARQRCVAGVGRSFQIPQPFSKLTVYENLLVAGTFGRNQKRSRGRPHLRGDPRADRADFEAPTQRRADCRCLNANVWNWPAPWRPIRSCLLLDEIAGGLTDAECLSLIETIKAIHAEGVTIIWIEHVLHALNSVVERLLVLDFGKVIGIGDPAAIMESKEVREIYLGIEI